MGNRKKKSKRGERGRNLNWTFVRAILTLQLWGREKGSKEKRARKESGEKKK